jgi:adenylate cyclase
MSSSEVLQAGPLRVDLVDQRAFLNGAVLDLGPKPFALLAALMRSPQRLVSKEELFDQVWEGRFVSEAVLTTAVRDLRRALGDDARQPRFIETAHGRGYRFLRALDNGVADAADAPAIATAETLATKPPRPNWPPFALLGLTLVVLMAVLFIGRQADAPAATAPSSIAVLPFEDISVGADRGFFVDGLTEEILTALQGEGLSVVSRTSSFAYRDRSGVTTSTIAQELGVGHVLEGSVRTTDTQVRVNVRLIEAATGRTQWTQSYERALSVRNLLAIQDEVARAIVGELRAELNPGAEERTSVSAASGTENLRAYELYLHARSLFVTRSDLARSISLARESVEADPNFAHGWELLAAASFSASGEPTQEARDATNRALRLNPNLSLAHALKGVMASFEPPYDWDTSVRELELAIQLDPTNTTAIFWLALQMHKLGYLDQAQTLLERCLTLDSAYDRCRQHLVWVLHARGRTDAAIAHYRTLVRNDAEFNDAVLLLAFMQRDDETEVQRIVDSLEHRLPLPELVLQALRDPASADRAAAQDALRTWLRLSNFNKRKVFTITLALGAYDMVFAGQGSTFPLWIPEAPEYRRSPEFASFVREMNIDDYWRAHGFPPQCRGVGARDFNCT